MTTSVNQAWAVLPDRAKADAPRQNGAGGETGFADAVKLGVAGKQARHSTTDAPGEARRPRLEIKFDTLDRAIGEPHSATANEGTHQWEFPVGFPDAADSEGDENSKAGSAEELASPGERTATETAPIAFRPPLPPMILLGGFDRTEAGLLLDGSLSSGATPKNADADSPPLQPSTDKTGAVMAKAAVAASAVATMQGNAKAASAGTGAPQESDWQTAKTAGKEGEPGPLSALSVRPPAAGAQGRDATAGAAAAASAAGPDSADKASAHDSSARQNAPDMPGLASRVTVLAQQNLPAPATPFPGLTAAPLLAAIATDGSWRELAATTDLRGLPSQNSVASAHSLKVQLHPAELGMVTASLRFAGEQLTVELQVESVEAQQRLSADADTIVKSLRALGLEVDRITIQQSTVVHTANARADASGSQGGQPAPDRQSFNATSSGNGNGQAGGQHSGRNTSNGSQASPNTAPGSVDRAGGGVYI